MGKYQGRHTIEKAECTALCWENTNVLVIGIHTNVDLKSDNNMITCILNGKSKQFRSCNYHIRTYLSSRPSNSNILKSSHLIHPIQTFIGIKKRNHYHQAGCAFLNHHMFIVYVIGYVRAFSAHI